MHTCKTAMDRIIGLGNDQTAYALSSKRPGNCPESFWDMSHWPYPSDIFPPCSIRPSICLLDHVIATLLARSDEDNVSC